MELNDIEPKNADFQYHSGSPLPPVSYLSRTPGYRIVGKSFGDKRGKVEIEYDDSGKTLSQRLKTWSDTLIEIHFPGSDPLQLGYWNAYVTVTRADSKRSAEFEIVRPRNPYEGYIRPQAGPPRQSSGGRRNVRFRQKRSFNLADIQRCDGPQSAKSGHLAWLERRLKNMWFLGRWFCSNCTI